MVLQDKYMERWKPNRGKLLMKFYIVPLAAILLFGIVTTITPTTHVYGEQPNFVCSEGKVLVYRIISDKYACVKPHTSERWNKEGISEPVDQIKSFDSTMETYPLHPEKMTSSAALPETAKGPQIDPSKGYLVQEIKDGLYWVTDGAYNTMFLTTGKGVIAVDAPPSIGQNYLKAIAEVTDEPVKYVIYSHTHRDHIGAASMFPKNATIIAHKDTAAVLKERKDPNRPVPTVTFDDKYTLELGSQKLELKYNGPIHEPGNIFIYAPKQKVLMVVDVVFPGWTPFKDLAMAQDVPAFLAAHDKIFNYDFDTYIGGHLTRLGTKEDVKIQKEYFEDIQKNAALANQQVSYMKIAQKHGFENPWLVFQIYADTITQQCVDATVPNWIDKLAGVDLFTYDHCWKISESQRID